MISSYGKDQGILSQYSKEALTPKSSTSQSPARGRRRRRPQEPKQKYTSDVIIASDKLRNEHQKRKKVAYAGVSKDLINQIEDKIRAGTESRYAMHMAQNQKYHLCSEDFVVQRKVPKDKGLDNFIKAENRKKAFEDMFTIIADGAC